MWTINLTSLMKILGFTLVPCCFNTVTQQQLKIRDGDIFSNSFIVQDYFCYSGHLVSSYVIQFHKKICKELHWYLHVGYIESTDCLDRMVIPTNKSINGGEGNFIFWCFLQLLFWWFKLEAWQAFSFMVRKLTGLFWKLLWMVLFPLFIV